ncbi:hypothetical protein HDU98_010379 [Podochytrium sp. JEL0797]|nr:hypothetical protein HDU98_010379 [Podochytrium sp. JEL0797]
MGVSDVAGVFAFYSLDTQDRWRILVGWAKAQQGVSDLSLESGLGGGFDLDRAERDVKELVPYEFFVQCMQGIRSECIKKKVEIFPLADLLTHLNGRLRGSETFKIDELRLCMIRFCEDTNTFMIEKETDEVLPI